MTSGAVRTHADGGISRRRRARAPPAADAITVRSELSHLAPGEMSPSPAGPDAASAGIRAAVPVMAAAPHRTLKGVSLCSGRRGRDTKGARAEMT